MWLYPHRMLNLHELSPLLPTTAQSVFPRCCSLSQDLLTLPLPSPHKRLGKQNAVALGFMPVGEDRLYLLQLLVRGMVVQI